MDMAESRKALSKSLNHRVIAPAIDMAGTFRNKIIRLSLWATYMTTAVANKGTRANKLQFVKRILSFRMASHGERSESNGA